MLGRGARSMTSLLCGWLKLRRDRSTLAAPLLWFRLGRLNRAQTWRRAGGPSTGWSLPSTCSRLVGSALVGATRRLIRLALTAQTSTTPGPITDRLVGLHQTEELHLQMPPHICSSGWKRRTFDYVGSPQRCAGAPDTDAAFIPVTDSCSIM